MLTARATSELARLIAPDSLGGLYTIEELEDGDRFEGTATVEEAAPKTTTKRRRRRELTTSVGEPEKTEAEVITEAQIVEAFAPDEHPAPVPPLPGEEGYEAPTIEAGGAGAGRPPRRRRPPPLRHPLRGRPTRRPALRPGRPRRSLAQAAALYSTNRSTTPWCSPPSRAASASCSVSWTWSRSGHASEDPTRDALHLALRRHASATHLQTLRKAEMVEFGKKCLEAARQTIAARSAE